MLNVKKCSLAVACKKNGVYCLIYLVQAAFLSFNPYYSISESLDDNDIYVLK